MTHSYVLQAEAAEQRAAAATAEKNIMQQEMCRVRDELKDEISEQYQVPSATHTATCNATRTATRTATHARAAAQMSEVSGS